MAQYRDRLVQLYAANKVKNIGAVSAFRQLCTEFSDNPYFDAERNRIEWVKVKVEHHLDSSDLTQEESVRNAVHLLVSNRHDIRRDLFHDVICVGYKRYWTEAQRAYFDMVWKTTQLKYDFFLSFTSRYPYPERTDLNPINDRYKHFIKRVLGTDPTKGPDRNENKLALAVFLRLAVPPIRGYHCIHQQYDNVKTEKKLEEACDQSLVFVQLIQSIMFYPREGVTNYCFFEWERIMHRMSPGEKEKRILYVLAEMDHAGLRDLTPPPCAEYSPWYQYVLERDRPHLPEAPFRNQSVLKALDERIASHLVNKIKDVWIELSVRVPKDS
jgi:hypothetical protein